MREGERKMRMRTEREKKERKHFREREKKRKEGREIERVRREERARAKHVDPSHPTLKPSPIFSGDRLPTAASQAYLSLCPTHHSTDMRPEWCGRCFKCCHKEHEKFIYRNPAKCGKCWKDGHIGTHYRTRLLNPSIRDTGAHNHNIVII
jgi:hypothetical protein